MGSIDYSENSLEGLRIIQRLVGVQWDHAWNAQSSAWNVYQDCIKDGDTQENIYREDGTVDYTFVVESCYRNRWWEATKITGHLNDRYAQLSELIWKRERNEAAMVAR